MKAGMAAPWTMAIVGNARAVGLYGRRRDHAGDDGDRVEAEIKAIPQLPHKRVCDDPEPGLFACHARIRTDTYGAMALASSPSGLGPTQLQSAYKVDAPAAPARPSPSSTR